MIIPLPAARGGAPIIHPPPALSLSAEIARLIEQHGPMRLATTLLVALARRPLRPRKVRVTDLSARLRRDIGLDPMPPRTDYWRHL